MVIKFDFLRIEELNDANFICAPETKYNEHRKDLTSQKKLSDSIKCVGNPFYNFAKAFK
jgi:hypothetical protein